MIYCIQFLVLVSFVDWSIATRSQEETCRRAGERKTLGTASSLDAGWEHNNRSRRKSMKDEKNNVTAGADDASLQQSYFLKASCDAFRAVRHCKWQSDEQCSRSYQFAHETTLGSVVKALTPFRAQTSFEYQVCQLTTTVTDSEFGFEESECGVSSWTTCTSQKGPTSSQLAGNAYQVIAQYFLKTLIIKNTADRKGRKPKGANIVSITQYHNPHTLKRYERYKAQVTNEMFAATKWTNELAWSMKGGKVFQRYNGMLSYWPKWWEGLGYQLSPSINEVLLYHGTSKEVAEMILEGGFDLSLAKTGMLGPGIYLAEMSGKSDEYTCRQGPDYPDELCTLIVSRAVLGNTKYVWASGKGRVKLPGTLETKGRRRADLMYEELRKGWYHSILGETHKFREFVLFKEASVYPEFVIHYKHVWQ